MSSQELIQKTLAVFTSLEAKMTRLPFNCKPLSYYIEAPVKKGKPMGKIDLCLNNANHMITILVYPRKVVIQAPNEAAEYAAYILHEVVRDIDTSIEYI